MRAPLISAFAICLAAWASQSHAAAAGSLGTQVARETLANGLRVVVVRDPLAPVVATSVNYLVG
ncbi:MAG TPA: hypothetical protein VFW10_05960, partial [Steroidobacteraceae bacterium]|nr:hypothetical protein [Steroidobacteraceae bacterium]